VAMMISITELLDYMRCHRQWDIVSPNRQGLTRKGIPQTALHIGSAVHHGIAAPVFGDDPLEAMEQWFQAERVRIGQEYAQLVGAAMGTAEILRLEESHQLARGLVAHYFERYTEDSIRPFRYIAAELSFRVPLTINGEEIFLVGTCDGLAEDPNTGDIWLVENKTYSQKPDLRYLKVDFQMRGYIWAMQTLLGIQLRGVLYNGLNKKLPKKPRVLANGTLSKEWLETTATVYEQALVEHHGENWREVLVHPTKGMKVSSNEGCITGHEFYGEFLHRLKERDEGDTSPFFTRHKIPFSQASIRAWSQTMHQVMTEIASIEREEKEGSRPPLYPNFRWEGCWDCQVADLCTALEEGDDYDYLAEQFYQSGGYRAQYKAMIKVEPSTVSSLEDLKRLMEQEKSTG
jgi:hypothetical protein